MRIALLTCAFAMLAVTQGSAALVLSDGSFETEVAGTVVTPGNTTGGWDVIGTDAFTPAAPFGGMVAAQDGSQFIQVVTGGGTTGRISQFLGTTDLGPANDITLDAYFSQRNLGTPAAYSFGLYSNAAGTIALAEEIGQTPGAIGVWANNSVTALGVVGGTDVYAFFTTDPPASSTSFLFVDNVTLTTVIPEPSSLLFGLGVLGLGAARRRR